MIPIIYYAHSMEIYHTRREQEELKRLQEYFSNGLIYNPNRPSIQHSKAPMKECLRIIKDPSITMLAFSHSGRSIPLGVYIEIQLAQKRHKPVYIIDPKRIRSYSKSIEVTKKNKATNWAKV